MNLKILVIPDVHLKPEMFKAADEIMQAGKADNFVCLMDIADDWGNGSYKETYDTAIDLAKKYPKSLWCYGNHDLSYVWEEMQSGYNYKAHAVVREKMFELMDVCKERLQIIHRVDNCLFMHGGLTESFVYNRFPDKDVDETIKMVNRLNADDMWRESSPIWFRPQMWKGKLYKEDELTQVVGHTPVKEPYKERNFISTDTFSTNRFGENIGNRHFAIVDTVKGEIIETLTSFLDG